MERYYKTKIDSETGSKIKALLDKATEFDMQKEVLRKKYGFGKSWTSSFYFRSLDIVEFKEEPDMTVWKRMKEVRNGYYPRSSSKNKEILKDFTDLNKLQIRRDDLDTIIGNDGIFTQAGFDFDVPGIYIFIVESDWKCKIPGDCEEITNVEYGKLMSK
jgi:hypothetical protein